MSDRVRRLGAQALLWAAPLGAALALLVLLAAQPYFTHGPDVPSSGDSRAWAAIWGALGLVSGGCLVGFVATVGWLARAWSRMHRPSPLEWFRTAVNLTCVAAFLWLWLG